MMVGYHRQPAKTREAEWFDPAGKRFIRTGDVGRFDDDGFLTLFDRKKDMIISGGFNIYPSDLEAVLRGHPAVADVAVVGVPSEQWGETPVAFVVRRAGDDTDGRGAPAVDQRPARQDAAAGRLQFIDELPRSAIGKVLKRELRERYAALTARAGRRASDGGGNGLLWVLLAAAVVFALVRPRAPMDYVRLVDWQTIGALAGLLAITQGVERSGMLQAAAARLLSRTTDLRSLVFLLAASAARAVGAGDQRREPVPAGAAHARAGDAGASAAGAAGGASRRWPSMRARR